MSRESIPESLYSFFGIKKENIDLVTETNVVKFSSNDWKKLLVHGDVQSGKTRNLIEFIKRQTSIEPHFIIFLTGTKNNLLKQNGGRFRDEFQKMNEELGFKKYVTSSKEKLDDAGIFLINNFISNGVTYITSELKRPQQLTNLYHIAKEINGKILIIDDEGDEASLAKNTGEKINDIVNLDNVRFISITATPYRNLYYNEKFYDKFIKLTPGENYKGLGDFDDNYILIKREEVGMDEKTILNPLISWAHKITSTNSFPNSQILFNFSLWKDQHKDVSRSITNFLRNGLNKLLENNIINREIYDFLHNFPTDNIFISNSDMDRETTDHYEKIMDKGYWIIIGGGNLSRGVTYKNLLYEVMINSPDIPNPGVLLQRARWFGYKEYYKDIRIYTTPDVVESFREIKDLDEWTKDYELGNCYKDVYNKKKYRKIKI